MDMIRARVWGNGVLLALVIGLIVAGRSLAQQPSFPSSSFTSSEVCGQCHTEIYRQWSETILSQAYKDPFYRAEMQEAIKDTADAATTESPQYPRGALSAFCVKCHSPVGVYAGEHVPADGSNMSKIALQGVQCDFCHTISGLNGISNGNYLNAPGNVKRGPFRDALSPAHDTAYSVLHARAEICGICHDIYNPANGLRLEATYFEWREGPYGKQGITCQDCHMTPGPGISKPRPGRAAIQGPEREHIYTHHFVGGNVLYGDRDLAIERLQAAARLSIEPPQRVSPGEPTKLRVAVRNVGAGHYLPTSLTYIRQMWLDVRVQDADGRELFADQIMYNTILEDANGVHDGSVPAWRAERIYRDYRIPPGEQVVEEFELVAPSEARGPLFVTAVLNYRSASPEKTAQYGLPEFPIIEMTREVAQLELASLLISPAGQKLPPFLADVLWWFAVLVLTVVSLSVVFHKRAA